MRGNSLFKFLDKYAGIMLCFLISIFSTRKSGNITAAELNLNKILIIKLSAMGDTILLIPLIRTLRESFPSAQISMVATSINENVARNCAYLNNVILFEPKKIVSNPFYFIKFIKLLRKNRFDIAIDADQWLRTSALLSYFSGAPTRVGFKTVSQFKHFLFTHIVPHDREKHELECFFDLARVIGINPVSKTLEYIISETALMRSRELLAELDIGGGDRFIILHPDVPGHAGQRQWPDKYFSELANELIKIHKVKVLLTGTKKTQLDRIRNGCIRDYPEIASSVLAITDLPIDIVAGIIKKSLLVICNNTGLMHLACAVGANVIALHGPTDPAKWGPIGKNSKTVKSNLNCSPCLYLGFEYKCGTNKCMEAINVKDVLKLIDF